MSPESSRLQDAADATSRIVAEEQAAARVLVIEDEGAIARYLVDLLQALDYDTCPPAASGTAGLKTAEAERPDVAIVDIGLLGDMDGIQTVETLRDRFGIPSIFLSGTIDGAVLARARTVNPLGFIQKPFMPREVELAMAAATKND